MRWWGIVTTIVVTVGVMSFLGVGFGAAIADEAGYFCPEAELYSSARVLPWGSSELIVFWAHVFMYPLMAIVGAIRALRRRGNRQWPDVGLGALLAAPMTVILAIFATLIQHGITSTFIVRDACGAGEPGGEILTNVGGSVLVASVVAALIGFSLSGVFGGGKRSGAGHGLSDPMPQQRRRSSTDGQPPGR